MVENITLKNEVTSQVLELDCVTTPNYILDSVDWGQISSNHHSYKYINQIGVYVTNTTLETRDISISGWIIANSESQMTQRKALLNKFVNPQQQMLLSYSKYTLEFLPDTSVKYSATVKENNEVICKFQIDGLAADPMFKDETQNKIAAATTKGHFHFPLKINIKDEITGLPTVMFGLRSTSLIVDVYNSGAVSTGMTIVFKAKGTLINPSLVNISTQEQFKINKTLVAGETVTINTTIGEKKITGLLDGVSSNYFKYRDLNSVWLQLAVGDNLLRYDAESGLDSLECFIYFYNRYLEVQECK